MFTAKQIIKAEFLKARAAAAAMSLEEAYERSVDYYNPLRRSSLLDRAIMRRARGLCEADIYPPKSFPEAEAPGWDQPEPAREPGDLERMLSELVE